MKYNLERFKIAQENYYPKVLEEIKNGKKTSHWMWFIFPQISGLGQSEISIKYEIANLEEAKYYLCDDLLSKRLLELTRILAYDVNNKTAEEIFGFPDYLKFHSCMTLFHTLVVYHKTFANNPINFCFEDNIKKYYRGELDVQTLNILNKYKLLGN